MDARELLSSLPTVVSIDFSLSPSNIMSSDEDDFCTYAGIEEMLLPSTVMLKVKLELPEDFFWIFPLMEALEVLITKVPSLWIVITAPTRPYCCK